MNLKESITAVKKFYQFLYEEGIISKIDFEFVKGEIKEMKDEWIMVMRRYDEEDYEDWW